MKMTQNLTARAALLSAMLAIGGAFGVSSSFAQTVTTKPVGAVSKTIALGLNPTGITLLNPDLVVANSETNTVSSITLDGVSNVGSLLTAGLPYYLEAVGGTLEGDRFDVDTAATILAANGTVVINTASVNNTYTLTADAAAGTQFALRKHVTLAQIQASCSTPLVGNNQAGSADQIWFYDPATDSFAIYFLRGDLVNWRASGSNLNVPNTIVPPGVGILIRKLNAPTTLVSTGGVRVNDFALPLAVGLEMKAPAYPVSFSPAGIGGTAAMGWTADNQAANADQLQKYDPATDTFTSYFLRGDGVTWRIAGTQTVVTNTELFAYDSAYFVSRKSADSNYILNSPISL